MAVVVLQERFGRFDWSGLSTDDKPTTGGYGSTFYVEDTDPPVSYVYVGSGWVVDNRGMSDVDQMVIK